MKLAKKYENILKLMAPTWMKKLAKARWDKSNLSKSDLGILNGNAQYCFMGEIHCMTSSYIRENSEDKCSKCGLLCEDVPAKMTSIGSSVTKRALLENIAEHIITAHPDLVTKKVQERAHLVFK